MALYYIYVRPNTSTISDRSITYYETSKRGIFDGVSSPSSATKIESNLNRFRLVTVPIQNKYKRIYYSGTGSSVTNTNYGMLTHVSNSNTVNIFYSASGSASCPLNITDQHGTHSGTPSGSYQNNQFIGIKHESVNSGYIYEGAKITLQNYYSGTIISSGGITEGLVTTFPSTYTNPIIIQCGGYSGHGISVEFLYSEQPTPPPTGNRGYTGRLIQYNDKLMYLLSGQLAFD